MSVTQIERDELEELYGIDIATFQTAMMLKLRMNMHKGHWSKVDVASLHEALKEECMELAGAIDRGSKEEVMLECADVAVYAMMIATNVGRKND